MNHNQPVIWPPPPTEYGGGMNRRTDSQSLLFHAGRLVRERWIHYQARLKVYLKSESPSLLDTAYKHFQQCVNFIYTTSILNRKNILNR